VVARNRIRQKSQQGNGKITRINVGVSPVELNRQHLLAEHREITRIPNAIRSGRFSDKGIPTEFTLGKGHVKFFYYRLSYLKRRYYELYQECKRRGYNVTAKHGAFLREGIQPNHWQDYTPTDRDRQIIQQRIEERLNT